MKTLMIAVATVFVVGCGSQVVLFPEDAGTGEFEGSTTSEAGDDFRLTMDAPGDVASDIMTLPDLGTEDSSDDGATEDSTMDSGTEDVIDSGTEDSSMDSGTEDTDGGVEDAMDSGTEDGSTDSGEPDAGSPDASDGGRHHDGGCGGHCGNCCGGSCGGGSCR
jgi:hypothetical protein